MVAIPAAGVKPAGDSAKVRRQLGDEQTHRDNRQTGATAPLAVALGFMLDAFG
jgi:hypothetical protein